jgi:voltage-gated potassium channel Kch
LGVVHTVKKHFPNLTILARASSRTDAYELLDAGVEHVYRETFDTSLRAGTDALQLLGFRAHLAHRLSRAFHRHDERNMKEMARLRHHEKDWLRVVRQRVEELERVMKADLADPELSVDAAWNAESLREDTTLGKS